MSSKPSIPKGTRDFSTEDMLRREYIFETIKQVFRLYGYQPIETPAMENLTTLLANMVRKAISFFSGYSIQVISFHLLMMKNLSEEMPESFLRRSAKRD